MELVMVGVLFSAMNFTVMTGFTSAIDSLVEPEVEGTVEIYQVESNQKEDDRLQRVNVVNANGSDK